MGDLLFEKKEGVAVVTFNRPAKKNAFTPEIVVRLAEAWREFRDDASLRVAILTGVGDTFSAGADLGRLIPLLTRARAAEDEWDRRLLADPSLFQAAILRRFELWKPVIAAVNGAALAGGCEILQGTDIRLAAPEASFGLPEPKRGIIPGGGSLVRLARQIPYVRAMQILLTGDPLAASTALEIGFVNEIVPREKLLDRAFELAATIAENGPARRRQDQGGGAAQPGPAARRGVRDRRRMLARGHALFRRARGAPRLHGKAQAEFHRALRG